MEQNNSKNKDELLKLAKRRVFMKKALQWHVIIFLIVNALLCAIYYLTTPGGYFWPMWSILGWGVGLILHIAVTVAALSSTRSKQDPVEKEYNLLIKDLDQNKNISN
jgi:hypothetical protein